MRSEKPARKLAKPKDMDSTSGNWDRGVVPILGGLPLWRRVFCVLDYHDWEERHALNPDGSARMKLRDQCGACRVYR